jgi:hypothetical protein
MDRASIEFCIMSLTLPDVQLQHRLDEQHDVIVGTKPKRRVSRYFGSNFWVTTSGHSFPH